MKEARGIEYQREVTVDSETYKVHLLPPSRAIGLSVRLMKIVGEPLAAMAGQSDNMETALPTAVRALTTRLDESEVLGLIQKLLETVTQGNKPVVFETHFQGRLGHMLKLVAKIVEVQFGDFFTGIGDLVKGRRTE